MGRESGSASGERERIKAAMMDLVIERGHYDAVAIEDLLDRAAVTEAAFERQFASKRACFFWIVASEVEAFNVEVQDALNRRGSWLENLRASAYVAADFIAANPRFARFGAIAMSRSGDLAQAERDVFLQTYVDIIDRGRQEMDDPESVSRAAAEAVVGSIFTTLRKDAASDDLANPENLVPQFMYMAVRPYLGDQVARQELRRKRPAQKDS